MFLRNNYTALPMHITPCECLSKNGLFCQDNQIAAFSGMRDILFQGFFVIYMQLSNSHIGRRHSKFLMSDIARIYLITSRCLAG